MARKLTPKELRQQAKDIMDKAKQLENEEDIKLGKYIRELANKGFNITYDELKTYVNNQLNLSTAFQGKKASNNNDNKDIA